MEIRTTAKRKDAATANKTYLIFLNCLIGIPRPDRQADRGNRTHKHTHIRTDGQRSLFEDDDEDAEEKQPDLAFHNSRASKPGDRLILCSSLRGHN